MMILLSCMRPAVWLLAADRRGGGASVNAKFEAENWKFDTGTITVACFDQLLSKADLCAPA
jgi:hypothetical protein